MNKFLFLPFAALAGCASVPPPARLDAPLIDYHQHLVSPAFEPIVKLPARDGKALVAMLDEAGVRKAIVLSVGYSFADERKKLNDPDRLTREENDWTSAQVAASGGRLIGFCSANPLRDAALQELERCLSLPGMAGIKQHLGNAGVTLRNPNHVTRMQQVFALAQRLRVPLLAHMRPRGGADYGAQDARTFLNEIVPQAPDVPIIIAHLGASSPGYPGQNDEIMGEFAGAVERGDPRMRNIYFDVSANVTADATPADGALIARRMRAIGVEKFLYGSDTTPPGGSVRAGWDIFRSKVPLNPAELQTIAANRLRFTR